MSVEAVTRLFLVRPAPVLGPAARSGESATAGPTIDGTLDFEIDEGRFAASVPTLERLLRRNPAAIFASPSARSQRVVRALAERTRAPIEVETDLRPRFLGAWRSARAEQLGAQWGSSLADRRTGAPPDAETIAATEARVLAVLDRIAGRFSQREVIVVLHADGIRAALARALQAPDANVFSPECGQSIALDWAHPEAKEFKHAVIGIGFDWDVAPPASKVHRFPGGASVLPRPS